MISGDDQQLGPLKEGNPVDIACQPSETGSLTIWFRVLDKAGMEFIASFSNGVRKDTESKSSLLFSDGKIKSHKLTLKSFSRERDSGLYGCSSLIRGKELSFGRLTRLFGGEFTRSGLERSIWTNPAFPLLRNSRTKTHRCSHDSESPTSHDCSRVHVRRRQELQWGSEISLKPS